MNAILSVGTLLILAFRLPAELAQQAAAGIPWWFWALMVVTLILLVWMLFNRPKEEDGEDREDQSREIPSYYQTSKTTSPFEEDDDAVDFGPYSTETIEPDASVAPLSPFIEPVDEEIPVQPDFDTSYLKPDDLTLIEGIGPKVTKILAQADIHTFAQLANSDADKLLVALASGGIFMTDPSSWPDQARFAAEGRWEELKKLQESLKGGRQVN